MTLQEIVEQYLKSHGYAGLYHPDGECACEAGDLWPCGYPNGDCKVGHYVDCPGAECEGSGRLHFHIGEHVCLRALAAQEGDQP